MSHLLEEVAITRQSSQIMPESERAYRYTNFFQKIKFGFAKAIDNIVANQIVAAISIAAELGRSKPHFLIATNNLRVHHDIHSMLQDTFNHTIRDSIDHGLEGINSPEFAIESPGKNGQLILRQKDNGRGINLDKVLEKSGLKTKMTRKEVAMLIFRPNLSTKGKASTISGRGVGMDFVKATIELLGVDFLPCLKYQEFDLLLESSSSIMFFVAAILLFSS